MLTSNWILLAILTGIFFGLQSVFIKILTKTLHQFQILYYLFLIAGFLLLPTLIWTEWKISFPEFFTALLISFFINIISFCLLTKAISISPISIVMPFVGLTPLFLTLTGFIILNEKINLVKFIGIILIVIGGFILQVPEGWKNKSKKGIRRFISIREKGIVYMIIVAFLWSITASVEKIAVLASSPQIYGTSIHLMLGAGFLILAKKSNIQEKIVFKANKLLYIIIALGLFSAILALCQLTAIKYSFVTYVISFKRAGIIVSSLIGFLYFKEKNYIKAITGTFCILSGAIFITIL